MEPLAILWTLLMERFRARLLNVGWLMGLLSSVESAGEKKGSASCRAVAVRAAEAELAGNGYVYSTRTTQYPGETPT